MTPAAYANEWRTAIVRNPALIGWALLIFTLPFHRIATSIPILLIVMLSIRRAIKRRSYSLSISSLGFSAWLLALYALMTLSLLWTTNIHEGITQLSRKLPLLILPICALQLKVVHKKDLKLLFDVLIMSCVLFALMAFVYAAKMTSNTGHNYFSYLRLISFTSMHPAYVSMLFNLSISICLARLINLFFTGQNLNGSMQNNGVLFLILTLLIGFQVLLAARTGLLILLLLLFFLPSIQFLRTKNFKGLIALFGLNLLLVMGAAQIPYTKARFQALVNDPYLNGNPRSLRWSENVRLMIWLSTFDKVAEHFIGGTGIGDGQFELQKAYSARDYQRGIELNYNTHNQYFEILLSNGLVGLSFFLCFLSIGMISALKRSSSIGFAFVLILIIASLTESIFQMQTGLVFSACFASLFALTPLSSESNS